MLGYHSEILGQTLHNPLVSIINNKYLIEGGVLLLALLAIIILITTEIPLPNEQARYEILKIHASGITKHGDIGEFLLV